MRSFINRAKDGALSHAAKTTCQRPPIELDVADGTLNEATARDPGCVEMRPRKRATCQERTWLSSLHTATCRRASKTAGR